MWRCIPVSGDGQALAEPFPTLFYPLDHERLVMEASLGELEAL